LHWAASALPLPPKKYFERNEEKGFQTLRGAIMVAPAY
jgi:hypothetical protein